MTDSSKPGPGRPSRSSSPADKRVSIRFTAAEYAALETVSGGSYLSDWIRNRILGLGAVVRVLGGVPAPVAADIEAAWSRLDDAAARTKENVKGKEPAFEKLYTQLTAMRDMMYEAHSAHARQVAVLENVCKFRQQEIERLESELASR